MNRKIEIINNKITYLTFHDKAYIFLKQFQWDALLFTFAISFNNLLF